MENDPSLPPPYGHFRTLSFITCFSFIMLRELCKYYFDLITNNFAQSTEREPVSIRVLNPKEPGAWGRITRRKKNRHTIFSKNVQTFFKQNFSFIFSIF